MSFYSLAGLQIMGRLTSHLDGGLCCLSAFVVYSAVGGVSAGLLQSYHLQNVARGVEHGPRKGPVKFAANSFQTAKHGIPPSIGLGEAIECP